MSVLDPHLAYAGLPLYSGNLVGFLDRLPTSRLGKSLKGAWSALHMQRIASSAQTSHRYHHHHHNHHHQHHHHHHHCHDDKPAKAGHQCLHLPADPLYPSSNAEKHPKSGKRGNVQKSSKIASNRTHNSVRSSVKARSWASCK